MERAPRLCVSPSAEQRLAFAADFLRRLPARAPALLILPSVSAGTELLARVLGPGEARFDWRKVTLDGLARSLSLPRRGTLASQPSSFTPIIRTSARCSRSAAC